MAFQITQAGAYEVEVTYSYNSGAQGSEFPVEVADQKLTGTSKSTGSWASYTMETLGTIHLYKGGVFMLMV